MGSLEEAYDEYGAILNAFDSQRFEEEMAASQKLLFTYIMNSEKVAEGSVVSQIHYGMILPVIKELRGLIQVYVFDCSHPLTSNEEAAKRWTWFGVCKPDLNPQGMPNLQKVVPPELKKNPYTGKPMQKTIQQFPEGGQINVAILKDWLTRDMPDYTIKIKSREKFDEMVKSENELDINKVILFTKKEKVTLPFKAASAELRDRMRFYVVHVPEKNPPADLAALAESYNATELPKLILEQTYDNEFDKIV